MNRKVVTGRTHPSSEEVNSLQNFGEIIGGVSKIRRERRIKISLATAAAAIATLIIGLWPSIDTNDQTTAELSTDSKTEILAVDSHSDLETLYPIQVENYDINPEVDNLIVTSNGTLIDVPAGSFSGSENVTLEFKDLSDPMTVFVSQISMDFDSLGVKYHFQSGGMFELTALSDNQVLLMNDGSEIQVSYPTLTSDQGMNQYRYDIETKSWTYDMPMPLDQLKGVCETHKVDFTKQQSKRKAPNRLTDFQGEVDAILATVPDEPQLASSKHYKFHFDFDPLDFPELAGFEDIMFQAKDSRFKRSFYENSWDAVELKKGKIGYSIVLKNGIEEENFNVVPVLQKDEYESALDDYENAKVEAEAKIDQFGEVQAAHKAWIDDVRSRESEYEFVSRDKAKVVTSRLITDIDEMTMYRTFNLPSLGVVNCDIPFQFPKGTGIQADFVGKHDDGMRRFAQVQLIEMDSPSYAAYHMAEYLDFRYRKGKKNLILAADHEGRIAVGTTDMFNGLKVPKGETHQFELKWMEGSFESLDELKAELHLLTDDYAM